MMSEIIQAYGVHWREEDVFWGAGNQAGSLLGVPAWSRTTEPIDFRQQAGIYVLYRDHELVYVGQAGSGKAMLFNRLKAHRRDQLAGRWNRFSWFGLRRVNASGSLGPVNIRSRAPFDTALNQIEAVLIAAAEPSLNKQGGRFGKRRRYLQCRDERLGPTQEEMLRVVYSRIQAEST